MKKFFEIVFNQGKSDESNFFIHGNNLNSKNKVLKRLEQYVGGEDGIESKHLENISTIEEITLAEFELMSGRKRVSLQSVKVDDGLKRGDSCEVCSAKRGSLDYISSSLLGLDIILCETCLQDLKKEIKSI